MHLTPTTHPPTPKETPTHQKTHMQQQQQQQITYAYGYNHWLQPPSSHLCVGRMDICVF